MIGGAPVTDAYAAEIGADGYGADASRAVAAAKQLMGPRSVNGQNGSNEISLSVASVKSVEIA
jgi:hypothetical protein